MHLSASQLASENIESFCSGKHIRNLLVTSTKGGYYLSASNLV